MNKKIISTVAGIAVTFASIGMASAQTTTTTSTPPTTDILGTVRQNLMNTRSVHVSGNISSTVRTSGLGPLIRFLLPHKWQNVSQPFGFSFDGVIDRSQAIGQTATSSTSTLNGVMSSWTLSNFTPTTTATTSISVVTNGGNVSFSADWLLNWLSQHNLINTTSTNTTGTNPGTGSSSTTTNWLTFNVPQFANEIGLQSWLNEKTTDITNVVNNPGSFFSATKVSDETVNGIDSYHYRIAATKSLISSMFPDMNVSSTTGTPKGSGDLWIAKSTLLPNRLTFTATTTAKNTSSTIDKFNFVANFDKFDSATTSQAPSLLRTVEDLLREVFQNLMNFFAKFPATVSNPGTQATPTTTPPTTTPSTPTSTPTTPTSTTTTIR